MIRMNGFRKKILPTNSSIFRSCQPNAWSFKWLSLAGGDMCDSVIWHLLTFFWGQLCYDVF
jgi:hypothetical protein